MILMDLISLNTQAQDIFDNFILKAHQVFSLYTALEGNRAGKTLLQFTSSSMNIQFTPWNETMPDKDMLLKYCRGIPRLLSLAEENDPRLFTFFHTFIQGGAIWILTL